MQREPSSGTQPAKHMHEMTRRGRGPKVKRVIAWLIPSVPLALVFAYAVTLAQVWFYQPAELDGAYDVALVLGAAAWDDGPSPVFRERLLHAVRLHEEKRVGAILVSGGKGPDEMRSEAHVGKAFLVAQDIPEGNILTEDGSRSTLENVAFSIPLLRSRGFRRVVIVSDPLHMKRAAAIAEDAGLEAYPSPTETSMYRGLPAKISFASREAYFLLRYRLGLRE